TRTCTPGSCSATRRANSARFPSRYCTTSPNHWSPSRNAAIFAATPTVADEVVTTPGRVRHTAASRGLETIAAAHLSPGKLNALEADVPVRVCPAATSEIDAYGICGSESG